MHEKLNCEMQEDSEIKALDGGKITTKTDRKTIFNLILIANNASVSLDKN